MGGVSLPVFEAYSNPRRVLLAIFFFFSGSLFSGKNSNQSAVSLVATSIMELPASP